MAVDGAYQLAAACCESLDVASALLDAEPELLLARTSLGETALHFLVVENQLDAVRWLFERGAALDTLSELAITPLSEAASLGHEALVDWLLESGAALDVPGLCAPVLVSAAGSGNVEIVRSVVAAGAVVAVADRFGRTALHVACRSDAGLAIVDRLLAAGASPDASRVIGKTPLDVAIESGASQVASLLRARGATTVRRIG